MSLPPLSADLVALYLNYATATYIRLTPDSCRKSAVRPTVKECQQETYALQQSS